mmetsp:Transcript_43466/g.69956  ORF Transcript_43466/g.69956 Transcript_43466/m.69956 type:complete len:112 (-) Transcript_43466:111-446(-)
MENRVRRENRVLNDDEQEGKRNKGESGGGSDAATAAALAPLSKGRAHISLACYGTEITDEILKRGKKCISSGNSKIDKKKNNGRSRKSESTTPTDSAKKGRQRRKSSSKRR